MHQTESDNAEIMLLHIEALYVHDADNRLIAINQWDGGVVPRFHLSRTSSGNIFRFRQDLPGTLVDALTRYCEQEPLVTDPATAPLHQDLYEQLLSIDAPIRSIQAGPAYCFTNIPAPDQTSVVEMGPDNTALLRSMPDWIADVAQRSPFMALVSDNRAVSVCASARITPAAHEAGVETLPDARRKGYALRVIKAWASAVQDLGALPLYSTSWENAASQRVAAALGLKMIGSDFHIT